MEPISMIQRHTWLGPIPGVGGTLPVRPVYLEDRDEGSSLRAPRQAPNAGDPTRETVLRAYWSASQEVLALEDAASREPAEESRRALRALQEIELQRKQVARALLADIWGIGIDPRRGDTGHFLDKTA